MIKRYGKEQLISMISEKTDYHESDIAEIFVALEEIVNDLLLSTTEKNDTEIRVIPGVILSSNFIPAHDKRMPDGSVRHIQDSIRFKAKITDNFNKSRRKYFEQTQMLWDRIKRRKEK